MKRKTVFQLFVLICIIGFGVFIVPGFIMELANANPVTNTDVWYSRPAGYKQYGFVLPPTKGFTLANPTKAFDTPISAPFGNDTWTSINYGNATASSIYTVGNETGAVLRAFKIPTNRTLAGLPNPSIQRVDIVMTWGANSTAQAGSTYQFLISFAGAAFTSFLGPQQSAQAKTTQTWSYARPGGGKWTWADISKIRIQVKTGSKGTTPVWMSIYDIKLNVTVKSAPRLFVSPVNVTDTTKLVGSTFTVYVQLENVSMSAGTEFKLRYDPRILNVTSTVPTPPASPAEDQALPADFIYSTGTIWTYSIDRINGIVYISYTTGPIAIVPPPTFGSGKVAQLDFKVLGRGLTTLKLYDSVQGKPGGATIPCDLADGYFRNVAMPYGATVKALVGGSQPKNTTFIVDINITKGAGQSGAFNLYSFQFNMTYNTLYLNATEVTLGDFLGAGSILTKNIDDAKGWVFVNSTLNGDLPGAWGNGTLAKITFDIDSGGGVGNVVTSPLTFVQCRLTRLDYGLAVPFPAGVSWTPPFYQLPATAVSSSVQVKYAPHDVAATVVTPEAMQAYKGYNRHINVTVVNQGSWDETFDVMTYYNSSKLNVNAYGVLKLDAPVLGYIPDAGWESGTWNKTGVSPYLGAADYPANYINTSQNGAKIGYFTFADVSSQGTNLLSVRLYLKIWMRPLITANDNMSIYVFDGTSWSSNYTVVPSASGQPGEFYNIDISGFIDTWAKVNATRMRIQKHTKGTSVDTIGIDYAYLGVNKEARAEISGWTKTGSIPYLDAADYSANYISTLTQGAKTGAFSFSKAPTYGQTLVGVKLYLKTWSAVDDGLIIYIYDVVANTWISYLVYPTSHTAPGSYMIVDIFGLINTWAKVNGTRMEIQKTSISTDDLVGVDHAYIVTESQIGTTQHVIDLKAGNSRILTFIWTTTSIPYGYYQVKAEALAVTQETDLADNVGSGGIIMMTVPGDVNGDKTVNVFDILAVKSRWGRTPISPDWIPEYDANVDYAINVFDILTIKANWGKSW